MITGIVDARNAPGEAPKSALPSFPEALLSFVLVAKFLGIPADPAQISHDRGQTHDNYSLEDLARIAKRLKIVARVKAASIAEMATMPLPALIEFANASA
ncbi:cysteine peptidase family C39 domain-containing protein [Variibacter gotjawalensis]|uniref:cysteine peptidase family C39 domain-containing protein n=1 Tax=Variibacter gotjawalensis TaxID=1333996 RepID=UPI000BBAB611|nr:cysteine peptidase family C39 domain-containing protein [Variibacter gotjawalensis]NIK50111.1 ABC-type bacteriocin/lantibiotic exporter with double-glycine peptidase domain [Variibacter gotjawalensis]